jgi:type II secretory pathway component PulM
MEMRLDAVTDFLNDQPWFQQLKQKWEELDPQSRTYLQIAGVVTTFLVLIFLVLNTLWSVHKLKTESSEKSDLLSLLQNANEEVRRLRDSAPDASASDNGKWDAYFDGIATGSGLDHSVLSVSAKNRAIIAIFQKSPFMISP